MHIPGLGRSFICRITLVMVSESLYWPGGVCQYLAMSASVGVSLAELGAAIAQSRQSRGHGAAVSRLGTVAAQHSITTTNVRITQVTKFMRKPMTCQHAFCRQQVGNLPGHINLGYHPAVCRRMLHQTIKQTSVSAFPRVMSAMCCQLHGVAQCCLNLKVVHKHVSNMLCQPAPSSRVINMSATCWVVIIVHINLQLPNYQIKRCKI